MAKRKSDIDITEEVKPARRKPSFALGLVKVAVVIGFCLAVNEALHIAKDWLTIQYADAREVVLDTLTIEKVVTEYKEVSDATLKEISVKTAKDVGLDPLIMEVIAIKESSNGKALYRFEKRQFEKLSGDPKRRSVSEDELRMLASSHGAFHVMGYTAEGFCKLHWSRLYNTWDAARCATNYARKCWDDTAHLKSAEQRFWHTFKCNNGTGPDAEKYADQAMNTLAGLLYGQLGKAR